MGYPVRKYNHENTNEGRGQRYALQRINKPRYQAWFGLVVFILPMVLSDDPKLLRCVSP